MTKDKVISELQHQLNSLATRGNESIQEVEVARNAQQMANNRCVELQNLLQELQDRTESQVRTTKSFHYAYF